MKTKPNFTARVRAIELKFSERMPAFKAALTERQYRCFCILEARSQVRLEVQRANTPPRNRGRVATLRSDMRREAK